MLAVHRIRRSRDSNRGFTLVEVLVTLAILAVMLAVLLPGLSQQIRNANSSNLSQNLKTVNDALQKYRENVGYYPNQLALLGTKPTTSNTDACGATLTSTAVALWKGPYLTLRMGTNGIQSGDAVIQNTLTRVPTTTTSSTVLEGELDITINTVSLNVATDVEDNIDAGATDFTQGTVRYVSSTQIMTWVIPISGC